MAKTVRMCPDIEMTLDNNCIDIVRRRQLLSVNLFGGRNLVNWFTLLPPIAEAPSGLCASYLLVTDSSHQPLFLRWLLIQN